MGLDDWTPERHAEAKERVLAAIASSHRLPPGLRDLRDALDEIDRLREEVRMWKQAQEAGDRHNDEMQAELDALTADMAAARGALERVRNMANEIEARAPAYDGKKVYADLRKMAAAIRGAAALRGEGAKDA